MKRKILLYVLLFVSITLRGNVYFKHLGKTDGLSQISVISICQDELGRMWFGTLEGLSCYDGNSMTVYKPSQDSVRSFLGNNVDNLVSDKQGNLFFISDYALVRYDLRKEQFSLLKQRANCLHVHNQEVWAATRDSVFKWDRQKEEFAFIYQLSVKKYITYLYVDDNECVWLGTTDGLYRVDNLDNPAPVCVIPKVNVLSLYRDTKGKMWVAAFRQGMYTIENGISQQFVDEQNFLLSNNDIRCFVEDDEGSIWIGTFNGLNKIDTLGNVSCYKKDTQPGSLKHSSIFSLCKDSQGTIWVGTYYGGVQYFNPQVDIFTHYSEGVGRKDCLSFFFVGNMVEDKRGDVWICTEGGGLNYLHRDSRQFTHYLTDEKSVSPLFSNLKCIEYDEGRDCLYIGTHKQGFFCFDITARKVVYHTEKMGKSLSKIILRGDSLYILSGDGLYVKDLKQETMGYLYPSIRETHRAGSSFLIDSKDYIWIAQHDQLVRINMKMPEEKYIYKYNERGLGKFQVLNIVEYTDGTLYFGTYGAGLYVFNPAENSFKQCSIFDIRYCYSLSVIQGDYLAVSCEKGLLVYHPKTQEMKMIDAENQLHLSAINDGCGLLSCSDGEVFVGGTSGMASFMSHSLFNPSPRYNLYFSSLFVNDKLVSCETSDRILETALPFADQINLEYNENNISISVASNSYIDNANRKIYEYWLEGFSNEWNTIYNNTIVYTNLNPGKYKLIVREKQQSSLDEVHSIALAIVVHSPWWSTWVAYLVYLCMVVAIAYLLLRNWRARMQLRASLAQEKLEKEKNEELIQAKLQFFANISHEFRTPLTLIISQLEALLQSGNYSPYLRTRLQKIYKNTFHFRELISELLDFRKMERGKLQLHVCQLDIILYLKQIQQDFMDQAQLKNIQFEFHTEVENIQCWFDGRQLRKVFSNLLSNAFKHTPEKGRVELQIEAKETVIEIKVIDTGEGIPEEALPYIFDRFYQVDSAISSPGSGIGLALSKGIVELHHGDITVQSAMHYGTIFTVTLPKENLFRDDDYVTFVEPEEMLDNHFVMPLEEGGEQEADRIGEETLETQGDMTAKDCLLIVEDNEDLLQILTSLLSPLYRITIAMNGKEGLQKAMEEHPVLILSDIMMPEMSGLEMCAKIKSNFDLCHIPVVLLTALTSDNKKMEGLQCGADDYIEKPFNNKMLLGRIANIIRNRKMLKQKFGMEMTAGNSVEAEMQTLVLNPIDAKFLSKLEEVIKEHLSDSDFDVNMLAKELLISRSSLYNKLKALSCMTPNEFILNTRLKYAADLLKHHTELQINEIAYQVGFNSPRYFRHCFKACFNQTPQEYRGS